MTFEEWNKTKQKFAIIFALVVGSIVLLSLNHVYGQENEVNVTIVKGSGEAGSGENKYGNHTGYGFEPSELTIKKGTIVRWINDDTSVHTSGIAWHSGKSFVNNTWYHGIQVQTRGEGDWTIEYEAIRQRNRG